MTLFPPLFDCAVLSLVTPVPRCSGQECLDLCSWWLATDATCLTDGLSIISLHRSLLSCPLFPSSRLLPFPQISHLCLPLMGIQKSFCYSQATLGPGKLCKIIQCSICLDAPTWLFPLRDLAAFWILHLRNDLRSFLPPFAVPTNISPSCFLLGLALGSWVWVPVPGIQQHSVFSSPPHRCFLVQEFNSFLAVEVGHVTQINSSCLLPNQLLLCYVLLFHKTPRFLKPENQNRPLFYHFILQ